MKSTEGFVAGESGDTLRILHWVKSKPRHFVAGVLSLFVALYGQQCAKVQLEKLPEQIDLFSTSANPYQLAPPGQEDIIRRYVFMIDMSNSMVSGPCIQDVNEFGAWSTNKGYGFDPNKGYDPMPQMDGFDCVVDPDMEVDRNLVAAQVTNPVGYLPYSSPYKTFKGSDYEGNRIEVVQSWVNQLYEDSTDSVLRNTKVMLVPVSGGESQTKLSAEFMTLLRTSNQASFVALLNANEDRASGQARINAAIDWFRKVHEADKLLATSPSRYRSGEFKMGATNPGGVIAEIYTGIANDMRSLRAANLLSNADYQVIQLTDGVLTPTVSKGLRTMLNSYQPCADYCAAFDSQSDIEYSKSCRQKSSDILAAAAAAKATVAVDVCSTLVNKIVATWGSPDDNTVERYNFYLGLIQNLPSYFGSGSLRMDMVEVNKLRAAASYSASSFMFDRLKALFISRASNFGSFEISSEGKANLGLILSKTKNISFKVANIFVYNPNVRMDSTGKLIADSDGDGLPDDVDPYPTAARSNGVCLDSMLFSEAYGERCKDMAITKSCDPQLDSDRDGLNECEEVLLGTNPFDFDTDADGMPDMLEYIYGFNPVKTDYNVDTNGDGLMNIVNFTSGVGPNVDVRKVEDKKRTRFALNYKGKESVVDKVWGQIWVDLYEVILKGLPVLKVKAIEHAALPTVYSERQQAGSERLAIPYEKQVMGTAEGTNNNTVIALARLIDKDRNDRAFWRIYKTEIPVVNNANGLLDLSKFINLNAMDRNQ